QEEEDRVKDAPRHHPRQHQQQRKPDQLDPARDLDLRRRAGSHRGHRTAPTGRPPAVWDWAQDTDGSLALDRHELWFDFGSESEQQTSQRRLSAAPGSVSVPPMQPAPAYRRPQRRPSSTVRRARRRALLTVLGLGLFVVLVLSAFRSGGSSAIGASVPASASRLLPAGPPEPLVIAVHDSLRVQLPVNQRNVTAIGYHAAGDDALPFDPLGHQANEGLFARAFHRIFGGGGSGLSYYQLGGGDGPSTGS